MNDVSGEVTNIDQAETLNASTLYPEFTYKTPAEALADPAFVFGDTA